jgi:hypothetical protein
MSGGRYEAVVAVYAHLVVSSSSTEIDKPVANLVVKAVAEEPQIEIQTPSLSDSGMQTLRNFYNLQFFTLVTV